MFRKIKFSEKINEETYSDYSSFYLEICDLEDMDDNNGGRSGDEDRLSNLPESLLFQVLLNLPTKDVVKCSVLSSRWRNLWRFIPGLKLKYLDFPEYNAFVRFVDMFLGFNSESLIQNFKLKLDWNEDEDKPPDTDNFTRWINIVVKRKVQHLHVSDRPWVGYEMEIPPAIYTCNSLVSLELFQIILPNPKFVSLPFLKVIDLKAVKFVNELTLEMLISGSPVLESLNLWYCENVQALRVCSQSLLRFTYTNEFCDCMDRVVAIDAPRLEYLELKDYVTSFIISNSCALVKVNINVMFNLRFKKRFGPIDPQKRNMIRNFLVEISNVKDLDFSSDTVEVIYDYSKYEPLPLFRNLSFLNIEFNDYTWELLPILLERCPSLKSLVMECTVFSDKGIGVLPEPTQCFLSSLEFVKIVERCVWYDEMKLPYYFLEKSVILKNFTLCLGEFRKKEASEILKKLLDIPGLSTSCQIVVL